MADIFLSYAHADRTRARPIVEMLQDEGWSVWWDRGIEPGMKWLPSLTKELANCRCVMVLWSRNSFDSEWVRKEAEAGLAKGSLIPIILDRDTIPGKFSNHQATDLSAWKGERHLTEVQTLFHRLAGLVPPSRIDTVRPGYDPLFLGPDNEILLPGVTGPAAVLRYNHFTVVMNPARRLAHYSAYNIDGTKLVHIERGRDNWTSDPLLPNSLQMDTSLLEHSEYYRGLLMARSAVSWGEKREALISNRQAFYWPNMVPRDPKFNRWVWLYLTNWEMKVAREYGRVTGFTGPVFSNDDEPFRGEMMLEDGLIAVDAFRVPRAFWKLSVISKSGSGLHVLAHLMDQFEINTDRDVSRFRVPLEELERRTGLRFGIRLRKAPEFDY